MTRDVLIRISGLQAMDGDHDDVEVITTGDYFLKNGKHYVIYDERMEGIPGTIRNTLKISPGKLDVLKGGAISAHMVFEQDHRSTTRYATPMGEMLIGVATGRITLKEQEDSLKVAVDYSLDINYDHVSDCTITIDVCSRVRSSFSLS